MKQHGITLIEILCVIGIIAILAGLIFPVFESTQRLSRVTISASNLRQIGLAVGMYETDYSDQTVPLYGSNPYISTDTWVYKLVIYGACPEIFSDPTRGQLPREFYYGDRKYFWNWVPHYGMNAYGYSMYTDGKDCSNDWGTGKLTIRHLASIEYPSIRIMVAPVTWGGQPVGFLYFKPAQASWPNLSIHVSNWDWYQEVWDTSPLYNQRVLVLYVDRHVGKIGAASFVDSKVYKTKGEYCQEMEKRNLFDTWGATWLNK